jgi:hypothetical protein
MILSETLKLLRIKEKSIGCLLNFALSLKRYRENSNVQVLRPSEAFYLAAVNSRARTKRGTVFIHEVFKFFGVADDENGHDKPIFLVTIADKFSRSEFNSAELSGKSGLDYKACRISG